MDLKYDVILWKLREADTTTNITTSSNVSWYNITNNTTLKILDCNNVSINELADVLWTLILELSAWSWILKEHKTTIPWEVLTDTLNYQWLYLYCNKSITITNVDIVVWKNAWTSLKVNLFKSSWVDSDWINTNATKIFTNDISLWTTYKSLNNIPNVANIEAWRYVSLRIMETLWTYATDLQLIITYL